MNSTDPTSFGTLNTTISQFPLAQIPAIFYEWAAILPLAIYLANPEQTYELVGKASLSDYICTAPFPKLGVLAHIARLLHEGPDFLDRVSSLGGLRYEVWDTNWGSVFPCANGSASRIITAFALRRSSIITIPESIVKERKSVGSSVSRSSSSGDSSIGSSTTQVSDDKVLASTRELEWQPRTNSIGRGGFRRYQTLHVLKFSRRGNKKADTRSQRQVLMHRVLKHITEAALVLILLVASVTSVVFGLYGTAVCIIIGVVSRVSCRLIVLQRADLYLQDNEEGKMDGCMLSAIHQNASTWYLFTGDRGAIDGILNKPMIMGVTPPGWNSREAVPGSSLAKAFIYFILFLSGLQLAAVTYVTAQKGWDSVGLLCFMLFSILLDMFWDGREEALARSWLQKHGVTVDATTFLFSGRVAMIGAIQAFRRKELSSWMDGIIQRNPRRDALLSGLSGNEAEYNKNMAVLDDSDKRGVERNVALARHAAELMQMHLTSV